MKTNGNDPIASGPTAVYDALSGITTRTQGIGLAKREHFAGLAMQGLCVGKKSNDIMTGQCVDIANEAVKISDVLIAALNKGVSNG